MASWLSNAARPPSPAKLSETRLCAILFILMYAIASRRQPTQASRASVTFLEEFCPAGLFLVERADSAAWPHRNRGTCGASRDPAKSLSPPQRYYFPKAFKRGSKIYSGEEGGRHGVELVFSRTYFLQNEFYSSPLKSSVEHVDVDSQRFHLRRLLKNIGVEF